MKQNTIVIRSKWVRFGILMIISLLLFVLIVYMLLSFDLHEAEQDENTYVDEYIHVCEEFENIINYKELDELTEPSICSNTEDDNKNKQIYSESKNAPETDSNVYTANIDNSDVSLDALPADGDCIIYIPAIELKKIVYTGERREQYLEDYKLITATEDMRYTYGGNYIICGHNSRLYGHSLNRLRNISVHDQVYIMTSGQIDTYQVSSITYKEMEDTNEYCEQNGNKQITILSCARYVGDNMYIVIKCIPNNNR